MPVRDDTCGTIPVVAPSAPPPVPASSTTGPAEDPSIDRRAVRSSASRRPGRRIPPGLAVVGVLVALVVGYALWAGAAALRQQPPIGTVADYRVRSDTAVDFRLVVTGEPGATVRCAVVARAVDFSVVGASEVTLRLPSAGQAQSAGRLATVGRATNAEAGSCEQR